MVPYPRFIKVVGCLLLLAGLLLGAASPALSTELDQVSQSIQAKGAKWVARENPVSSLPQLDRQMRLGALEEEPSLAPPPAQPKTTAVSLPAAYDWRAAPGGNFVTKIKDQKSCGSCWAFAVTAALESKSLMTFNRPGWDLDLSEQIMLSCSGAGSCNGGYVGQSSDFLISTGLGLESCDIYTAHDDPCGNACPNWQQGAYKIDSWWNVSTGGSATALKTAIYQNGPVVVTFKVYSDFYYYHSGVYSYTSGTYQGGHAVLAVGWDDASQAFIVKNSWGSGWGDSGYFRIAYSEMTGTTNFASYTAAYGNAVNSPPIANAGSDQTIHAGKTAYLDGSGSSDPGGHTPLTYAWSFTSRPAGSTAALSNPAIMNPTFVPDKPGDYVVQLTVTNTVGTQGSDTVTVSTTNSAPVAAAGPDQTLTAAGVTITLNGAQSYDPNGDPITFQWSFVSRPAGSNANLTGAATAAPTFVADVHGDYVIQLVVSDPWAASAPDTVKVAASNAKPVANAGTSQSVSLGATVTLNGSASYDPDGDPLTYHWNFTSVPSGSAAALAAPLAMVTTFTPDLPGAYVAQLVVNDGSLNSDPGMVQIQVAGGQDQVIQRLQDLIALVAGLDPAVFRNSTQQNKLINKLNAVIALIESGRLGGALTKLKGDILPSVDGCAKQGYPHKTDWIIDCTAQGLVYPELLDIISLVSTMKAIR